MDYCGNLNTAIAIRTIIMRPKGNAFLAQVQSGAGIVADSVPESEFVETQSKARALFRAIDAAEARTE
jgi:anthranilate synthase component 1